MKIPGLFIKTAAVLTASDLVVDGILEDFCDVMVERAKDIAPYQTGNLRRSIDHEKQGILKHRVFTQTGYGAHVELGTKNQRAQPFMAPAFQATQKEFEGKQF